ncbi:glucokinase [Rhodothalassium salexigens]|uniref:glucokinase n=1 Tax=Rhodothalassium salexigens TaxID=1086 RepID=UPI001911E727|nr:glucokinase [Rhodothalassium salexigens]MBK5912066.1 glucokinase [Rhodothalassium salexigens]MBK5921176.1 glucokinase [Rhodothalassium salexigens]
MTAPALIADIGGTNVRFALAQAQDAGTARCHRVATFRCADFPGIAAAVRAYYDHAGVTERPRAAVLAAAGPVHDGVIALTNHVWRDSLDDLAAALEMDRVIAINDFEAVAHAAAVLPDAAFVDLGRVAPPVQASRKRVFAITGPGTGLGVALLVTGLGEPVVVATEGGHTSFAPQTERQREIARFLAHDYARLSVERLLSGPGLVNIHRALSALHDQDAPDLQPHDITRLAFEGDDLCRAALDEFYAILGCFAGDLALMTGARAGVVLAGGILPPLARDLAASGFRRAFEDKGRFSAYTRAVPTRLIVDPQPGLAGVAAVAQRYLAAHDPA